MINPSVGAGYSWEVAGASLLLLPQKAIYWPEKKSLLVADVHLGKTGHFRKAGIPVPAALATADLEMLEYLMSIHEVEHLYFLGDLFHSQPNGDYRSWNEWMEKNHQTFFHLIAGNHDHESLRRRAFSENLILHPDSLYLPPFVFRHEPTVDPRGYVMAGHLHPAISIKGKGRSKVVLACFWFHQSFGVLPAFGRFTGKSIIQPHAEDHIFGIADHSVIPIQVKKK